MILHGFGRYRSRARKEEYNSKGWGLVYAVTHVRMRWCVCVSGDLISAVGFSRRQWKGAEWSDCCDLQAPVHPLPPSDGHTFWASR